MPLPTATFSASDGTVSTGVPSPEPTSPGYGPDRLYIPSLGVNASLVAEGIDDGALMIPSDPGTVGWYEGNPGVDAAAGTTILAGHVTNGSADGALVRLHSVAPGALIVTTDSLGRPWKWHVVSLSVVSRTSGALPPFPSRGPRALAIVTCGGAVTTTSHGRFYAANIIAVAAPGAP